MNSSLGINNNIKDKKTQIKKEEKETNLNNNIINNIEENNNISKIDKKYSTENNIYNNNINVNNDEMIDNIRDMLIMSKQINNNISKIKHENIRYNIIKNRDNHKNPILLRYEDYKAKIKKFKMSNNLTSREKNKKLNYNSINNTTNKTTTNKLNKEFISVEKMFKKYNSKEWNEIYIKRFKSYQDNINKKKEEMRKTKELANKMKEDEIINYSNKKKSKSYKKYLNNRKYKPLFMKEKSNKKESLPNYFRKILERRFEIEKNNEKENIYNKRYIDKDLENIKNNNIICYKGNIFNLEEERKILIAMSKRKNLFRSASFKNINQLDKNEKQDLKLNKNSKNDIVSETDKLIYEFIIRHLEQKMY